MITSLVVGALLILVGVGGSPARAQEPCCGASCRGPGLFHHAQFVPNVTYYAVYPFWWPQYFGPPYTDYLVVQYVSPPAETALLVKQRILAINAGNPALLPLTNGSLPPVKEPLPPPKRDELPKAP